MSPPAGFDGEYRDFLKSVYQDLGLRQRLIVLARRQAVGDNWRTPRPVFSGPYAAQARAGLDRIFQWKKDAPALEQTQPRRRSKSNAPSRRSKYGPVAQI